MNYATNRKGRLCWASRLPLKNERIASAVEAIRGGFFHASAVVIINGEVLAAELTEHGKKHLYTGRLGQKVAKARLLWDLVEVMRKIDSQINA